MQSRPQNQSRLHFPLVPFIFRRWSLDLSCFQSPAQLGTGHARLTSASAKKEAKWMQVAKRSFGEEFHRLLFEVSIQGLQTPQHLLFQLIVGAQREAAATLVELLQIHPLRDASNIKHSSLSSQY